MGFDEDFRPGDRVALVTTLPSNEALAPAGEIRVLDGRRIGVWWDHGGRSWETATAIRHIPDTRICGVVIDHGGVPIACGWPRDHLAEKPHSWSVLPTVDCAAEDDEPSYTLGEFAALTGSKIVFVPVEED